MSIILSAKRILAVFIILAICCTSKGYGQDKSAHAQSKAITGDQAVGRWDLTVRKGNSSFPSWLEIKKSGLSTLVGRFVGKEGSARPVSEIKFSAKTERYSFAIPPQWSDQKQDIHFNFTLDGDKLSGKMDDGKGKELRWTGVRAPELSREKSTDWGSPVHLLRNGLSQWKIPENSKWSVENGVLVNGSSGGNLITKQKYDGFKLHIELRYPEGSNSGIYLRGRYEVQVIDSYGMEPESHLLGGIYGFIDPSTNAAKKANQWQTYDISLRGRMVTVVLNGTKVICNRPIPGITGGALDSDEDSSGPIMLQGDHGPVQYRNIIITSSK